MIELHKLTGRLGNKMFQFAYIYSQMKKEQIDDIYVQDPELFEDFEEDIKHMYGANIPEKTNKVAIHVRRGDYVRNPFYCDLSITDYYEKAMAHFPNAKFLIFSDDIEWCKEYFEGDEYEFCEEDYDIDAINIMASCVGHIIANSSFSWWGAYISPYTQKIVAPSKDHWYADKVERTKCPNNWIRI